MSTESEDNPWFYNPSLGAAALFCALYGIQGGILAWRIVQSRGLKFGITVMIGVLFEITGYGIRAGATKNQNEVGPYAAQQSLIVLAPLFIAAGNYLIISRLICSVSSGYSSNPRVLGIPARKLTPIFVVCDIITLLVQISGTSIAAAVSWVGHQADVGNYTLIAGLAIQTVTITFFCTLMLRFALVSLHRDPDVGQHKWRKALRAVFISSVMIALRCIYRLVEFATGLHGYLFTHEWPFYVLEAVPMIIALGVLVAWYPPEYLPTMPSKQIDAEANVPVEETKRAVNR